jgi:hypothetical protein
MRVLNCWPGRQRVCLTLAAILALSVAPRRCASADNVAAPLITVSDNGGWSWFEDERAIIDQAAGKLIVATIANGAGFGGAARSGDVEVASIDLTTHATSRFLLRDGFPADDHNTPALYLRPDGRYAAMFAAHNSDNLSRWRVSTHPGDISAWSAEQSHNNGASATYSNLHFLPNDNGGAGRLYNFVRSVGWDPNILVSSDQGSTWAYGGRVLAEGGDADRPYVRYASDGNKIHFLTTERHPRDFNNSIYHGYIQDGKLYDSSGAVVDANLLDGAAVAPSALSPVFAANTVVDGVSMQRAWTVDAAIDNAGMPVGVFQARAGGSDLDHRYFYSRWNGSQWQVNPLGFAGSHLYAAENDYTGLVAIDPSDVNTVYLSSEVNPATKAQLFGADGQAHYELFRGRTQDNGATWAWTPVTFNSTVDNIRPHVPKWDDSHTALVWMRGQYSTYTSYNMRTVAMLNPTLTEPVKALAVDFGATGQLVQNGFSAFTRDQNPAGAAQTQLFSSPYAAGGGQIAVTVGGGDVQFRDRGGDVAGPMGDVVDDFVFNSGTLTLAFGNLQAGDYQLVLYAHDRDSATGAYRISLAGSEIGRIAPTTGAAPPIGVASSRVQFHASGLGDVLLSLDSLTAANVTLNGFELYAAPAYLAPPPIDLNGDGALDLADFLQYIGGMHKNLTGMTASAAYAMGDVNGDLKNDYADLLVFRQGYNQWNGAGAFEAAFAAPEPSTAGLLTLGVLIEVARRRGMAGESDDSAFEQRGR